MKLDLTASIIRGEITVALTAQMPQDWGTATPEYSNHSTSRTAYQELTMM